MFFFGVISHIASFMSISYGWMEVRRMLKGIFGGYVYKFAQDGGEK